MAQQSIKFNCPGWDMSKFSTMDDACSKGFVAGVLAELERRNGIRLKKNCEY